MREFAGHCANSLFTRLQTGVLRAENLIRKRGVHSRPVLSYLTYCHNLDVAANVKISSQTVCEKIDRQSHNFLVVGSEMSKLG